jgi:hypothetical protein
MKDERRGFLKSAGGAAAVLAAASGVRSATAAPQEHGADRALWISWYDLPDEGRDAYLSWLHGSYIPALLQRPGFLGAAHYAAVPRGTMRTMRRDGAADPRLDPSLPTGDRYLLLFGAEHSNVFGNPAPSALHAALGEQGRKMLAMRAGERVNIMTEAARVDGPEAKNYKSGMTLAPCIQLGNFNCAYQDEEDMLAWYAQSRMPAMATLPGAVRTRKLASVSGWAKHAILYEFVSLEARNKYYATLEDGRPEAKAWADRIVPKLIHAPGSASLATRIWPA